MKYRLAILSGVTVNGCQHISGEQSEHNLPPGIVKAFQDDPTATRIIVYHDAEGRGVAYVYDVFREDCRESDANQAEAVL